MSSGQNKDENDRRTFFMTKSIKKPLSFSPVNIAYASNEGYAQPLAVSVYSLLLNSSKSRLYDIIIMHKEKYVIHIQAKISNSMMIIRNILQRLNVNPITLRNSQQIYNSKVCIDVRFLKE